MKEILMSIHNEWANLIFSHKKTVELRKNIPVIRNSVNNPIHCRELLFDSEALVVYIYDTDQKSVTGRIYIDRITEITEISDEIVSQSCVNRDEIEKYKAQGKGKLYAWHIVEADYFGKDWLHLKDLGAKRAPQSWQFVR